MANTIGSLILEAREKAKKSGRLYIANAKDCTCEVEVDFFTANSSRERYSRCAEHQLVRPTKKSSSPI